MRFINLAVIFLLFGCKTTPTCKNDISEDEVFLNIQSLSRGNRSTQNNIFEVVAIDHLHLKNQEGSHCLYFVHGAVREMNKNLYATFSFLESDEKQALVIRDLNKKVLFSNANNPIFGELLRDIEKSILEGKSGNLSGELELIPIDAPAIKKAIERKKGKEKIGDIPPKSMNDN